MRPDGIVAFVPSYIAASALRTLSQKPPGKSIAPGVTTLTRICFAASADDIVFEWLIIAALTAAYAGGEPAMRPETEEMCTIEPPPAFSIHGTTFQVARTAAIRSMSKP